jgi:molybdate/tungstate transport system ATP-binding protein
LILGLRGVSQARSGTRILDDIDLYVPEGSFFVLMGPTGCGKTTLLRIAGLIDRPSSGRVEFDGTPVPERGPDRLKVRREMVTLFQRPVLFRGTVRSNVEWGLRIRGTDSTETRSRVSEVLEMVGLEGFAGRDAATLSGGELQRTALARALVIKPKVLLLDEPTASVDPGLRLSMVRSMAELQGRTGITFLMATHDFSEALSLGTAGAVMRKGSIEQTGTMDDLFYSPRSHFMASFVGFRNIHPADFRGDEALVGELTVRHTGNRRGHGFLAVSPESIVLSAEEARTSERNRFPGRISSVLRSGATFDVEVDCAGVRFVSSLTRASIEELGLEAGKDVFVSFKASSVHIF